MKAKLTPTEVCDTYWRFAAARPSGLFSSSGRPGEALALER